MFVMLLVFIVLLMFVMFFGVFCVVVNTYYVIGAHCFCQHFLIWPLLFIMLLLLFNVMLFTSFCGWYYLYPCIVLLIRVLLE